MSYMLSRLSPASCAIFDYLADGQWAPQSAVLSASITATLLEDPDGSLERGKVEAARARRKHRPLPDTSDDALRLIGAKLIARNTLMIHSRSSHGRTAKLAVDTNYVTRVPDPRPGHPSQEVRETRIRFATHAALMDWREARTALAAAGTSAPTREQLAEHRAKLAAGQKSVNPITASIAENTPHGIPESLMWRFAPRQPLSMAHFSTDQEINEQEFRSALPDGWDLQDSTDGKYRVWVPVGIDPDDIKTVIRQISNDQGRPAKSLKVEASTLLRRRVRDLPAWFRDYLFPHYLRIATGHLARKRHTSAQVLGLSNDDLDGYVALWLLDAAASFDPEKSNFGQYSLSMVQHRFGDLMRHMSGRRYASKIEADVRRAEDAILADGTGKAAGPRRAISDRDLGAKLGVTAERARDMRGIAGRVAALRAPISLDIPGDNGEPSAVYALASDIDVTDDYEREEEHAFATRLLIQATAPAPAKSADKPATGEPNVLGMMSYYLEHICGMTRSDAAAHLHVDVKDMNTANGRVRAALTVLRPAG